MQEGDIGLFPICIDSINPAGKPLVFRFIQGSMVDSVCQKAMGSLYETIKRFCLIVPIIHILQNLEQAPALAIVPFKGIYPKSLEIGVINQGIEPFIKAARRAKFCATRSFFKGLACCNNCSLLLVNW